MKPASLEYINLDEIPSNSFLIIRVDVPGPMEKFLAMKDMAKELSKYKNIFITKNITIMVMTQKETMEVLTETEMNNLGWSKNVV
jgi:hypothetical protein